MANINLNTNENVAVKIGGNKKLDYINWCAVTLIVIITLLMKFNIITNVTGRIFIPMFIFAWIHGTQRYGLKNMGIWFILTWIVSNLFEGLSIMTGFPFGHYYYAGEMGPRIWNVPIFIMVAYFAISYTSWTVTHVVTSHFNKKIEGIYKFIIPITSALLMTMWDLVTDPQASTVSSSWIWKDGGNYFGVPISNFIGWVFVVYFFSQIFTLFISNKNLDFSKNSLTSKKMYWVQPCIIYLAMGLGVVIDGFTHVEHTEIYASMGMIAFFTVVFNAGIGLLNIKNSKELC
ncbi:hypothetical protein psyc5s11_33710 [Clostridium gelidum]|uniref:Carotenoid biosynthesis protein n=1 Tax=Clostridium gelidum TaxID=704125 RepID=A0ABM7T7B7_9CLOT|nr:carotenoid biosynthesis protein [Clostridium gelidum]BCZ47304.1 hypothetical protein psyc5s11_33710 [Clostridium gelidum]